MLDHLPSDLVKIFNRICDDFTDDAPKVKRLVLKEPYFPFIPRDWNGILVLAEAQNLSSTSSTNDEYVSDFEKQSKEDKYARLYCDKTELGVWPWDNGALKLALTAAFIDDPSFSCKRVAVSNAVPWSKRTETGANANPDDTMMSAAVEFWKEVFPFWMPDLIIASGEKAEVVITRAKYETKKIIRLRLPACRSINPAKCFFDEQDLLSRYPEVIKAEERLAKENVKFDEDFPEPSRRFFACHAVSLIKGRKIKKPSGRP